MELIYHLCINKYIMVTNPIKELFASISDAELTVAVNEIIECEKTGYFAEDSIVRNYARKCSNITSQPVDMYIGTVGILREASFRWANQKK